MTAPVTQSRNIIPANLRGTFYIIVPAIIAALAPFNVLDNNEATVWTSVALAAIAAVFAVVNGESTWRNTIYVLFGAVQALLQLYGLFSDQQWAAISGIVVALLSIGLAGLFTPAQSK